MCIGASILAGIVVNQIQLKSDSLQDKKNMSNIEEKAYKFCEAFGVKQAESVIGCSDFHTYLKYYHPIEKSNDINEKELESNEIKRLTFLPSVISIFEQQVFEERIAITMPHFEIIENKNTIDVTATDYLIFSDVNKRDEINLNEIIEEEDRKLNIKK